MDTAMFWSCLYLAQRRTVEWELIQPDNRCLWFNQRSDNLSGSHLSPLDLFFCALLLCHCQMKLLLLCSILCIKTLDCFGCWTFHHFDSIPTDKGEKCLILTRLNVHTLSGIPKGGRHFVIYGWTAVAKTLLCCAPAAYAGEMLRWGVLSCNFN